MYILGNVMIAAAGLLALSCTPGVEPPGPVPPTPGERTVRFRMGLPHSRTGATRAADDAEFAVNDISLLVFTQAGGAGDFTYQYTAVGRRVSQANNTAVDFEALMVDCPDPVRLLAVANPPAGALDGLSAGMTETAARSALVSEAADFSQGLPMTGVAQLAAITATMGTVTIPLVRSIAKVTVGLFPDTDSPSFTITGVQVWRNPTEWQVFPDADRIANETTAPMPTGPSVEFTETVVNRTLQAAGGIYSGYISETAIPTGDDPAARAACVIVSGRYADDTTDTFYRVNFGRPGNSANPPGQVVRNYWYELTILGVDGPGWESAESAAANPATGLRTTVTPWNGGGNTDYYFGAGNYIRLSAAETVLGHQTGDTATMTITTSGVPFSVSSVHWPGAGLVDISGEGGVLETQKMRFAFAPLTPDRSGEQKWQLTVTAMTAEPVTDYLQLHAAEGLMTISIFVDRDEPPIPPPENDPAKRKIRVLNLGEVTYGSMNRQTTYGVPAMLRNTTYFGPEGTVVCAGVEFVQMLSTANSTNNADAVRTALQGADIIVTPYNYRPNAEVSYVIYEWLTAPNSGRAALLSMDETQSNYNLRILLDGGTRWQNVGYINNADTSTYFGYGTGYTGVELPAPPASGDDEAAPFLVGPFGNARSCANPDTTPYDGTTLYFNIAGAQTDIVPLIVSNGNAGQNTDVIMVGVNPGTGVVYNGCATLLHTEGMTGPVANTTLGYNQANYLNAMWANTWAWMVNKVITENYDVAAALIP